ncbi:MAG: LCP family protein [Patescibacteria group bacterium]
MEEVIEAGEFPPKKDRTFQRIKRRVLKHIWLVRIGLLASVFLGAYLSILLLGFILARAGVTNYGQAITNFIFAPTSKVETKNGRTNILLLGKGGQGHEASDLTDTIIFGSIAHAPAGISLFSLPRDIWVPAIRAKVNSAYYWGNQKQENGGLILAKSTVEEMVGQPVHYGIVVDFSAFTKIIDVVEGIAVDVARAFVDEKYPIPGKEDDLCDGDQEFKCRYETLKFEKGLQVMDGETALKFVRSRNAQGEEGTDLARIERQQKVLVAVRKKVLSAKILLSPKKLFSILKVVRGSVESDITPGVGAVLVRRALNAKEKINSYILSEEFLLNPPISPRYDNLYVFIPKAGNWSQVQDWIKNLLP